MHCYKIVIIIKKIAKVKICHLSDYFRLVNLCFSLNKWHYRVFLIQLLRVLIHHKGLENKQKLVKSHSLTYKLNTIKNHAI